MIIDVKVPMLSESVSEGTLLEWKKKVGEAVARDEILIDIETDKVVWKYLPHKPAYWLKSSPKTAKPLPPSKCWHALTLPLPLLLKQHQPPRLRLKPLPPQRKPMPPCLPPPNWQPKPAWM